MGLYGHEFVWTFVTALTNLNTWKQPLGVAPGGAAESGGPIARHLGLGEFGRVVLTVDIPANNSGDTFDLVIQTTSDRAGGAGTWRDIARINTVANAAP